MFRFHTGGIAQYLEWCIASRSFVYSDVICFYSFRKKLANVWDAAGDLCMAITVMQYFIVIERW